MIIMIEPLFRTNRLDIFLPSGSIRKEFLDYQFMLLSKPAVNEFLLFYKYGIVKGELEANLKWKEENGGTSYLIKERLIQQPVGICGLNYHDTTNRRGEFGIAIDSLYWRK